MSASLDMSGQPESPRPLRILLVEDDATSRWTVGFSPSIERLNRFLADR